MARSDEEIYSVSGESDGDDLADELSPSDGYFHSSSSSSSPLVPNVPNVLLPDPTLQQNVEIAAEPKAREADRERLLSRSTQSTQFRGGGRPRTTDEFPGGPPTEQARQRYPAYSTYTPSSSSASAAQQPERTLPPRLRSPSVYSEAPPAYTPSPHSPLSPSNPSNQARTYSIFSTNMGAENEALLNRDPESMGQPGDDPESDPLLGPRIRVRKRIPRWLNWRNLCFVALFLLLVIGLLTGTFSFHKPGNKTTIRPHLPPEEADPPKDPQNPDQPDQPEQPKQPVPPQQPSNPEPPEHSALEPLKSSFCKNASYRFSDQIMAVQFKRERNISFAQDSSQHQGDRQLRVGGQVNIRQLDAEGYPRIVLEIVTNDENLQLDVYADDVDQRMKVSVPRRYDPTDLVEWPCVEMRATIWVPKGGELNQLDVKTVHLDVLTLDDLDLKVEGYTGFRSIIGDMMSGAERSRTYDNAGNDGAQDPESVLIPARTGYTLDSRVIDVNTNTGTIQGNWPLYDVLSLRTTSGTIDVNAIPKPELKSAPKPAVLSASSISGPIHIAEPLHDIKIPLRDYVLELKSTSGGIRGALAFGSNAEMKSTSGTIDVELLPVMNMSELSSVNPSRLQTSSTSGTTDVRVLEPLWYGHRSGDSQPEDTDTPYLPIHDDDPYKILPPPAVLDAATASARSHSARRALDCLQSTHKGTSADITLRYPQSWVGDLSAETMSGILEVRGRDVTITRQTGGWPKSRLEAYKGKESGGGSTISVKTMMGSLDAVLGDE